MISRVIFRINVTCVVWRSILNNFKLVLCLKENLMAAREASRIIFESTITCGIMFIVHNLFRKKIDIAYIKYKKFDDYTGIESYVSDKLKANDLSWIPFNKAIELANLNDDESVVERRKVTNINEEV